MKALYSGIRRYDEVMQLQADILSQVLISG
jgi:hypothetical protein